MVKKKKLWFWRCIWDDGVSQDRDVCFAEARWGFKTMEEADKAGHRHLNRAKHKSIYPERHAKKAKIYLNRK